MKIKITKLKESDNPIYPNNIAEGFVKIVNVPDTHFSKPEVGRSFILMGDSVFSYFSTSTVQEILTEDTFRTYNSIYKWEILDGK